jgi:aryl-alcohol dehydrogenase-like predicted oxidoreductase
MGMEYRLLGNTGIKVSNLSFGASSLGGVFHSVKEADGITAVHAAIDNGINLIDVSPYYGDLKAEIVLGKALRHIPRDKYHLSTKVGRYWTGGKKSWDYSAGRVVKSIDESLKRLNIDYIDFIHCHDIEFSNTQQIIEETLPALHEVKRNGKVRHVGITGLPLEDFKYIIDRTDEGMVETIITFCHYSLNDDALLDYLDYLETHKVGIINAAPLSMGLLTERGVPDWHPAEENVVKTCKKAVDHCISKNEKIEKLAVQYSVGNPRIPTTLVSTSNPKNILLNIQWAHSQLNKKLLSEVLEILKPIHRITWENS